MAMIQQVNSDITDEERNIQILLTETFKTFANLTASVKEDMFDVRANYYSLVAEKQRAVGNRLVLNYCAPRLCPLLPKETKFLTSLDNFVEDIMS